MPQFLTVAGKELTLPEPRPESVLESRRAIAKVLSLQHYGQVVLLLSGAPIEDSDSLPLEGSIQVATKAPPEGTWSRIVWDANALDTEVLREALDKAFPAQLGQLEIPGQDRSITWYPQDYWQPEEAWAKWCSKQMELATVEAVGDWANFWEFGSMADTYGYWMVKPPFRNKTKTLNQVVSDVQHWAKLLNDLDATFHNIQERTQDMNPAETMEIAAAQLLRYSPSFRVNTSFKFGFETWYAPFGQTLQWYANFAELGEGLPRETVDVYIQEAVGGVFSSYSVTPDGAKKFAQIMASRFKVSIADFDATSKWLSHRPSLTKVVCSRVSDPEPCNKDTHFDLICSSDAARSAERADCMKRVLFAARAAAKSKQILTLQVLKDWSGMINGLIPKTSRDITLRRADAYGKKGRERYPLTGSLEQDVINFLRDAEDKSIWPQIRAARVYLDICFYHPFDDGNGRLARVALDFVLTKNGLCLKDVDGLFSTSRSANDGPGAQALVEIIQQRLAEMGPAAGAALDAWSKLPSTELEEKVLEEGKGKGYGKGTREDYRKSYAWFDCLTSIDFNE